MKRWLRELTAWSGGKRIPTKVGRGGLGLEALEERSMLTITPVGGNAIIFVADGLRHDSVNATDAPTLFSMQQNGVNFINSHALFPTFTTPNASAIATGHFLGDTGDFSNTIFTGFPVFNDTTPPNPGTNTPFIENNLIIGDVDEHFPGTNFLDEQSLLAAARLAGYNTAAVGKLGPVLLQDNTQGNPTTPGGTVPTPATVIIDDSTGKTGGIPLPATIQTALTAAGLPPVAPDRTNGASGQGSNGFSGNNTTPGTTAANVTQQQYFVDATTKAILPTFLANMKANPSQHFVLVFWSRDPDGTQHNQGDSLNTLTPGINGPTSKAAVKNADTNLKQILDALKANGLDTTTDVFVTADHGFSTISKQSVDAPGTKTTSYAATITYKNTTGVQDVNSGFLPVGFVAIDIAHALNLPLFDPDSQITNGNNVKVYEPVDPTIAQQTATVRQRPANGDGLIGGTGQILNTTDAQVVVAANGGSDLIYIPGKSQALANQVVDFLSKQDYVSGIFYDDKNFAPIPGALPMSSINLVGTALTPLPSIMLNFRTFASDGSTTLLNGVEIADSGLQQGQGMHGSFGRQDTFNNMVAFGPNFKKGYMDIAPVSNVDLAPTLASILGLTLTSVGTLKGRVINEALIGGPETVAFDNGVVASSSAASGLSTFVSFQSVGGVKYFDAAGGAGRTLGLVTSRTGDSDKDVALFQFVRGLYRDLVYRPAEDGGLNYWVNLLRNGTSRSQVQQGIAKSDEALSLQVGQFYTLIG